MEGKDYNSPHDNNASEEWKEQTASRLIIIIEKNGRKRLQFASF